MGHRGLEAKLQEGRWWEGTGSESESEGLKLMAVLPHPYRPLALDLAVWVVSSAEGLMHVGREPWYWPVSAFGPDSHSSIPQT